MSERIELPIAGQAQDVASCEGCGACCLHMAVPPYDAEELELIEEHSPDLFAEIQAIQRTRRMQMAFTGSDEVPCAFFDWATRRCRHHDNNPDICHRFEVGGEFCLDIRRRAGISAEGVADG